MPIDAVAESMISIGQSPSSALAATCADCIVAERCADRLTQTMPSAPSSCRRAERLFERADRRGGGLGEHSRRLELAPELVGGELLAVDVLAVAEADRERNDLDAELCAHLGRKVTGTVGHDANGHGSSSGPGSSDPSRTAHGYMSGLRCRQEPARRRSTPSERPELRRAQHDEHDDVRGATRPSPATAVARSARLAVACPIAAASDAATIASATVPTTARSADHADRPVDRMRDPAAEHDDREHRGDRVRAAPGQREPLHAERREQREREHRC